MSGIQQLDNRLTLPKGGTIRLGFKDEGDKGRMHNTEYFILKDAPEVAKIYGEDPKEIDIMFPFDSLKIVADSAFEFWTGKRNAEGKNVGFLTCRGNGPTTDGVPGTAEWKEWDNLPPQEECLGPRDPATGFIQRVCYGDGARGKCRPCINSRDSRGYPACKPTMVMRVIVPLVSPYHEYKITTHSWNTITDVLGQLKVLQLLKIPLPSRAFTLHKESKAARPWDAGKQVGFKTVVSVVKMRENLSFMTEHRETLREVYKAIVGGGLQEFLPVPDMSTQLALPAEQEMEVVEVTSRTPDQIADELMADPEITVLFDTLEHFKQKKYSVKQKRLAILNKTKEADVKAAVVASLTASIEEAQKTAKDAVVAAIEEVQRAATVEAGVTEVVPSNTPEVVAEVVAEVIDPAPVEQGMI